MIRCQSLGVDQPKIESAMRREQTSILHVHNGASNIDRTWSIVSNWKDGATLSQWHPQHSLKNWSRWGNCSRCRAKVRYHIGSEVFLQAIQESCRGLGAGQFCLVIGIERCLAEGKISGSYRCCWLQWLNINITSVFFSAASRLLKCQIVTTSEIKLVGFSPGAQTFRA